ncbi:hypothetical protein O6H91_02G016000 [Diphasiastrum complanatum]|uniref:Uncharacterized protein n=2 Tax=Diphasiastrum complanatum TaxID=34168 RepID=A0ACC2ED16_DIPCM|nr:hypothetical protein O6H91_02G016000 [Diphasiastrum complanatum]
MNDLLSQSSSRNGRRDLEAGPDLEMLAINTEKNLAGFFQGIGELQTSMDNIKDLLKKLEDTNEESKSIHSAQAMKDLRARMDKDVEMVLKTARVLKKKLEDIEKSNIANRRTPGCEEGTPTDRTRTAITGSLRKKLKDLMGEFQVLREKIMGEYKETIERRYYTVTGKNADEETIEHIIETGESETFLQKAIQEQGRGQVIETIREIQERHSAVKEIEKNLLELHQIFLDMSVLVESQGEQLNNIEAQVNRAASFVEHGTTQLFIAKKHQRNTRKWMCIGIILLLIIIVAIVVPIVKH